MTDAPDSEMPRRAGLLSEPFERNFPLQALALLAWSLAWMAAQTLLERSHATPQHQVTVFMGAGLVFLGGVFLLARKRAFDLFTSVPFAVTQMVFLAMAVLLGTLVLQELKWAEYTSLYGAKWWGGLPLFLVRHAHVDDVYHSLWFYGLLLLISLSTLLVAWKRRPYPLPRFGFLLVHIAPALILAGGLVGKYGFVRAFNELKQGEPTRLFWRVKGPNPNDWKDAYALPDFRVKLEKFEVQTYEPEFKLYAFVEPDGKGGFERNPKAYEVKEGLDTRLPLTWTRMKVDKVIPDAVDDGGFQEDPKAASNPVLKLMLGLGTPEPWGIYLLADHPRAYRFNEPDGRFALLLKDHFDPAKAGQLKPHGPSAEKLQMEFMGKTLDHDAKPGSTWSFPAFELKVVKLHPDFPFKQGPNGPIDLAQVPPYLRGPWLEVELHRFSDGARAPLFLCARTPAFSDQANAQTLPPDMGMTLHYVRENEETQRRFVVYSLDDQQARLVEDGRVIRTEPWSPGKLFAIDKGLSATVMEAMPHAVWKSSFVPNPDTAGKTPDPDHASPAIQVTLTDDAGKTESHWLSARNPDGSTPQGTTYFDGKIGLQYHAKDAEPKDFRSVLVIEDKEGHELARKQVSVNDPLVYKGHWFYQSNYDPKDATVSGIMVVYEPGLWLTYLGFACLIFGSLWMFYLKPWLKARAERKAA
ncbi:MAG: cytochrome c biogenesis protein ResB [Acidobacteria bacterium]|nr:cytochrome c biogenesis protein ResB [Acidobacteriota bacterium]